MKKILSLLVIAAMLTCLLAISAFAADAPPPPPPGEGTTETAAPAAAVTVTFVSDKGVTLASSPAEGGSLVFGIVCASPTDIVSITVSAGTLECQQSTAGGPSTPQGTINGIWTLSGITADVTVTLVLNTQDGAAPPTFYFGADEAAAGLASASAAMDAMGPPPDAAGATGEAAPAAPDAAPPAAPEAAAAATVTFVSDAGAELASAPAENGELVFGIVCSPPTDIVSIAADGGALVCQQSTAGGPSTPQGTINGIWTLSGITANATVTLVLNTQEGADPPAFYFGDEAAANVGASGGAPAPEAPAPTLAGPATGEGNTALPMLVLCLLGLAVTVPVLVKKISK